MCSNKVDARPRLAAMTIDNVPGSAESWRQSARRRITLPKCARRVTEFVIPFRPTGRKSPHLITARSAIPGFGNQLHRSSHRVLTASLEKTTLIDESIWLAGENRSQIKAKPVDFGFLPPVAKPIGHH